MLYIPILTISKTNAKWLAELTAQLDQLDFVKYQLHVGSKQGGHHVFFRRYQVMQQIPSDCTHIMWMDPDDLVDVNNLKEAWNSLTVNKSIIVMKQRMDINGKVIGKPRFCCKNIASKKHAMEAADYIYKQHGGDCDFTHRLHSRHDAIITYDKPVVYWRQHDDQMSKK